MILTGTISYPDGSYGHIEAEGATYEDALLEEHQNLIAIRKD